MMPALIRGLADQSQISLMNQGGGLKRLPWLLPGHPLGRQLTKLVVDEGEQLLRRLGIALLDRTKDLGDVAHQRRVQEKANARDYSVLRMYEPHPRPKAG